MTIRHLLLSSTLALGVACAAAAQETSDPQRDFAAIVALNEKGWTLAKLGQQAAALAAYDEAIRLASSHPDREKAVAFVLSNRSKARLEMGDVDGAIVDAEAAIKSADNAVAQVRLGEAAMIKGDVARALRAFDAAIQHDPDFISAYQLRAEAEFGQKNYDGAIRDLDRAMERALRPFSLLLDRAAIKHAKEDYDGAIVDATRALALEPRSNAAHLVRGRAYGAKEEYDRAAADLDVAIGATDAPTKARALATRAWIHEATGENPAALRLYREALTLLPGNDELTDAIKRLETAR